MIDTSPQSLGGTGIPDRMKLLLITPSRSRKAALRLTLLISTTLLGWLLTLGETPIDAKLQFGKTQNVV
jgi:hypothetical protein